MNNKSITIKIDNNDHGITLSLHHNNKRYDINLADIKLENDSIAYIVKLKNKKV